MIDNAYRTLLSLDDSSIKRTAAKVVDEPIGLFALNLKPVGECRGHGLLQKRTLDEPGKFRGLARCVALVKFEGGRDRNNNRVDILAEPLTDVAAQFLQNLGGKRLRAPGNTAAFEQVFVVSAHLALELREC